MTTLIRKSAMVAGAFAWSGTFAQTVAEAQTGSIGGVVRDSDTKQPIDNVSVFIQGTNYGVQSKANGTYTILGVPPGTYTVVARRVSYVTAEIENVVVRVDVYRVQNIEMAVGLAASIRETPPSVAAPVQVQGGGRIAGTVVICASTPGTRLGIRGFQSASLSYRNEGARQVFSFQSAPVILDVEPWSSLRTGDILEAINGEPITTRAGGDQFGNPVPPNDVRVTIRRGSERMELVAAACLSAAALERARVSGTVLPTIEAGTVGGVAPATGGGGFISSSGRGGRGGGSGGGGVAAGAMGGRAGGGGAGGRGGAYPPMRDTIAQVIVGGDTLAGVMRRMPDGMTSVEVPRSAQERAALALMQARAESRLADILRDSVTSVIRLDAGTLVRCTTPCTRATASDGNPYWRHSRVPQIQSAGRGTQLIDDVQAGDYITAVNGEPITSEAAGVLLTHASVTLPLQLEITRNGERKKVTVKKRE